VLDRDPGPGVAAHVGAHRSRAEQLGLDKADDVQRIALLLAELAQDHPGGVAGAHALKVAPQLGARHPVHPAKAPVAGELALQVHRFHKGFELLPVHLFAGGVSTARTLEPEHRGRQALHHLGGDLLAPAREIALGIGLSPARQRPGGQGAHHQAQTHDDHRQTEAGKSSLANGLVWVHGVRARLGQDAPVSGQPPHRSPG